MLTAVAGGLIVAGMAPGGVAFQAPLGRSLSIARRVLPASFVEGIAFGIGIVLFIVPGLILFTRWAVLVPILIREDIPWTEAFGRSWSLTKGSGWPIFGALVLVLLAYSVVFPVVIRTGGLAGIVVGIFAGALLIAYSAVLSLVIYEGLVGTGASVT